MYYIPYLIVFYPSDLWVLEGYCHHTCPSGGGGGRRRPPAGGGGGGAGAITDQNFEDALRQVTAFVEKLHRASLQTSDPSSGAVAKFRDFQNLLREIRRQVGEIVDRRLSIDDRKSTAERQAAEAKATLDRIEDLMRQLDELLRRRGRDALDDARKAEKEFGRQSQEIAAMAEESRRLAEQHEQVRWL